MLARLGVAAPPAFVGRAQELELLGRGLAVTPLVVVRGAVGAGKTRLVEELAARSALAGERRVVAVGCLPGDRVGALRARAERALDALPGQLVDALRREPVVLVVDDAHRLPDVEASALWSQLAEAADAGRVVLVTREALPLRPGARRTEIGVEGLDDGAARELWSQLEERHGPATAGACDAELARTGAMPLALRRGYARARFGEDAWSVAELAAAPRDALRALSVLRCAAAPAAVSAMLEGAEVTDALAELVARQLVEPTSAGRFLVHDVVREEVLDRTGDLERRVLFARAAEVLFTAGRGDGSASRLAWAAGDDGAFGLLDPVDRLLAACRADLAAGQAARAAGRLRAESAVIARRGGGGEVDALLEDLVSAGVPAGELAPLRAEIAVRRGEVGGALLDADALDPILAAELRWRAGEVEAATAALRAALEDDGPERRCRAAATLAEIDLARGAAAEARQRLSEVFERDCPTAGPTARARVHLAFAALESWDGDPVAARAALIRAASAAADDAELAARVAVARVAALIEDGRAAEAAALCEQAVAAARCVDAVAVADELALCRARLELCGGDALEASVRLTELVARRRDRGDELGATLAELELAASLVRRGELGAAAQRAASAARAARVRGLDGLGGRAALLLAEVELGEGRRSDALRRLAAVQDACLGGRVSAHAAAVAARASGRAVDGCGHDDIDALLDDTEAALWRGDGLGALPSARAAAVAAERAGRAADLARALALVARFELARGERAAAAAAAARAAREALGAGATRARAQALLVLAALARDDDELRSAATYARDAQEIAAAAGAPIERLAAALAAEVIAGGDERVAGSSAATATAAAQGAAEALLADLGLTVTRPYRVVNGAGGVSFVAEASPEHLRASERELVIDAVRETIARAGRQVADLRRRSLLKRLLFLFAGAPGEVFSKEQIVESVWQVEYHPLRHDAALFTNIMRIRRLLGDDGAELLRVSEDGYAFVPGKSYLYVEHVEPS